MNNREAFDYFLGEYWNLAYTEGKTGESQGDKANEVLHKLREALASQAQQTTLAKHQPCGCVICTCEHETQCQGCGAKNCGTHEVGNIPNPVYLQLQAQQPNAWQQAIDDELVNAHLGIAKDGVTHEEAKAELNKLIAWHIDAAKYFESQAQQEPAKAKHHPICDRRYPSLCDACNAEAQAQQPCDMNELCLDCQPRGKNGECPDQLPPASEEGE